MSSLGNLLRNALEVRRTHGVGLVRQCREILRLSREPGRLGPAEYYDYRVFLDSLPCAAKREFLGWRGEQPLEFLNQRGCLEGSVTRPKGKHGKYGVSEVCEMRPLHDGNAPPSRLAAELMAPQGTTNVGCRPSTLNDRVQLPGVTVPGKRI